MTFGNKAYDAYTLYPEVILIALSYFLAKDNNDILIEKGEQYMYEFSRIINCIEYSES
jgi:hypothetical protein